MLCAGAGARTHLPQPPDASAHPKPGGKRSRVRGRLQAKPTGAPLPCRRDAYHNAACAPHTAATPAQIATPRLRVASCTPTTATAPIQAGSDPATSGGTT
jgi:hypothetical protein